jgi:transcriptional regulator
MSRGASPPPLASSGFRAGRSRKGRERIVAAPRNSGFKILPRRVTTNLSPGGMDRSKHTFNLALLRVVAPVRHHGTRREPRTLPLRFYRRRGILEATNTRSAMTDDRLDLPQGTLDLLILKALSAQPMHGWAISERIRQVSREVLRVPQGSLYPALHRLERRGWIAAEWGTSENNRRAKFYELTRAGRKQLDVEADAWARLTRAVSLVLKTG